MFDGIDRSENSSIYLIQKKPSWLDQDGFFLNAELKINIQRFASKSVHLLPGYSKSLVTVSGSIHVFPQQI